MTRSLKKISKNESKTQVPELNRLEKIALDLRKYTLRKNPELKELVNVSDDPDFSALSTIDPLISIKPYKNLSKYILYRICKQRKIAVSLDTNRNDLLDALNNCDRDYPFWLESVWLQPAANHFSIFIIASLSGIDLVKIEPKSVDPLSNDLSNQYEEILYRLALENIQYVIGVIPVENLELPTLRFICRRKVNEPCLVDILERNEIIQIITKRDDPVLTPTETKRLHLIKNLPATTILMLRGLYKCTTSELIRKTPNPVEQAIIDYPRLSSNVLIQNLKLVVPEWIQTRSYVKHNLEQYTELGAPGTLDLDLILSAKAWPLYESRKMLVAKLTSLITEPNWFFSVSSDLNKNLIAYGTLSNHKIYSEFELIKDFERKSEIPNVSDLYHLGMDLFWQEHLSNYCKTNFSVDNLILELFKELSIEQQKKMKTLFSQMYQLAMLIRGWTYGKSYPTMEKPYLFEVSNSMTLSSALTRTRSKINRNSIFQIIPVFLDEGVPGPIKLNEALKTTILEPQLLLGLGIAWAMKYFYFLCFKTPLPGV